jgi:hypothetical protein
MASTITALILICATALPPRDCTTDTAIDVVQGPDSDSIFSCGFSSQAMIAQSALNQNLGKSSYLKIVCMPSTRAAELFHRQPQNASIWLEPAAWSEPAAHRDALDYDEVPGAPDADDEPGAGDESTVGPGQ